MNHLSRGRVVIPLGLVLLASLVAGMAPGLQPESQRLEQEELPAALRQALSEVDCSSVAFDENYAVEIDAGRVEIELTLDPSGRLLGLTVESP